MSIFDKYKEISFRTVGGLMGTRAVWNPVTPGTYPTGGYVAKVLFNNPTEQAAKYGAVYDAEQTTIEYFAGDFPGLYQSAEVRGAIEVITLTDDAGLNPVEYMVKSVVRKHDGDTYVATIQINQDV